MSSLKELRQEKGITAFALAVKANVSLSTITRMESGDEKRAVSRLIANKVLSTLSSELGRAITIKDVDNLKILEDVEALADQEQKQEQKKEGREA